MTTTAAEAAAKSPPSCLAGFRLTSIPVMRNMRDVAAEFAIQCGECGSETFDILGYPVVAPNPSPYSGISPGEVLFRPPHGLRCVSCKHVAPLFDARTQGYDGVLNGGCSYQSGETGETATPGQFKVSVSFIYNIDLSELEECAEEAKVRVSDLFDGISIVGSSADGIVQFEVGYECA